MYNRHVDQKKATAPVPVGFFGITRVSIVLLDHILKTENRVVVTTEPPR